MSNNIGNPLMYLELAKHNPKLIKHCAKNRRRLLQKEMAAEATAAKLGAR